MATACTPVTSTPDWRHLFVDRRSWCSTDIYARFYRENLSNRGEMVRCACFALCYKTKSMVHREKRFAVESRPRSRSKSRAVCSRRALAFPPSTKRLKNPLSVIFTDPSVIWLVSASKYGFPEVHVVLYEEKLKSSLLPRPVCPCTGCCRSSPATRWLLELLGRVVLLGVLMFFFTRTFIYYQK